MSFLEGLNSEQKSAVLHTEGPLLILAGAGSGKTRVLTHRIAHLINNRGVKPYNILAITFTNKAANEMKERVRSLIGDMSLNMWISTFHSACARILRMEIEKFGYRRDFVIYDDIESQSVIKDCMKQLNINDKVFSPKYVNNVISRAKEVMEGPELFERKNATDFRMSKVAEIYKLYQKILKQNNALDYDDLIFLTVELFEKNGDILKKYQNKFRYIMVDEYQDTNGSQYRLISLLAKSHGNLCVVGDDDQSIYAFRGADITNILSFEKEFKAKVIKLEQNYRSTSNILEAANSVISNNYNRKNKKLWTAKKGGSLITRFQASNEHEEASFVVSEIKRLAVAENRKYSDFAILYRMNALSRVFEETLMRSGVPYKIIGGLRFYDRKEIKDIVAYLRLINNLSDDYALKRIINVPKRGIGDTTFEKARQLAIEEGKSIFEVIMNPYNYPALSRAASKLSTFAVMISTLVEKKDKMRLSQFIEEVMNTTGIIDELQKDNAPESKARIENLKEFLSAAVEYENDEEHDFEDEFSTLSSFLESLALVSDADDIENDENYVLLMTMHSAKGLEFPVVFLVGFEEGIFPGARSLDSEFEMEEERRLCYVGITRAQEMLYITNSYMRMLFGTTKYHQHSRFIDEIPVNLLTNPNERHGFNRSAERKEQKSSNAIAFGRQIRSVSDINSSFLKSLRKNESPASSIKSFSGSSSGVAQATAGKKILNVRDLKTGLRVKHKKFGVGTITKLDVKGNDTTVEINFDGFGMRRLLAIYANLEEA